MLPTLKMRRQKGFTLLELIVVIVVIGLVSAYGIKYFIIAMDRARATGVEMLAWRFAQSVSVLRAWSRIPQGVDVAQRGVDSRGVHWIAVDGVTVYLNERLWPATLDPQRSPAIGQQTAHDCEQLLDALFEEPISYLASAQDGNDYRVFSIDGRVCRYQLVQHREEPWFFDYNLETGKISVSVPRLTIGQGLELIPNAKDAGAI